MMRNIITECMMFFAPHVLLGALLNLMTSASQARTCDYATAG